MKTATMRYPMGIVLITMLAMVGAGMLTPQSRASVAVDRPVSAIEAKQAQKRAAELVHGWFVDEQLGDAKFASAAK